MENQDKLSKLNEEKSLWEARRASLDKITSEFNSQISNSLNREKELEGQRAASEQKYREGLKEPHKNIEQINTAQDEMKAADLDLAKNRETLADHTNQLRSAVKEQAQVDNTIQELETQVERTQKLEELKTQVGDTLNVAKEKLEPYVEPGIELAAHTVDHVKHWNVLPSIPHQIVSDGVESAKFAYETQKMEDSLKMNSEKVFHDRQLAEVADLKTAIASQMGAAKAEMEKVLGQDLKELSPRAQKDFHQNEFSGAFNQANELIANQQQQRDAFFANNGAVLPNMWIAQQQDRAGMNQELQAAHYGLTRELSAQQATINVEIGNTEMTQLEQKRQTAKGVPEEQLTSAMEKLKSIQDAQEPGEVYRETNKIHAQNCPELYRNPPAIDAPGGTPPGSPPPPPQGPGSGPPPPGM